MSTLKIYDSKGRGYDEDDIAAIKAEIEARAKDNQVDAFCQAKEEQVKAALQEFFKKTDFVQDMMNSGKLPVKYLGRHRADILRELVENGGAATALLKECLATLKTWSDMAPSVSLVNDIERFFAGRQEHDLPVRAAQAAQVPDERTLFEKHAGMLRYPLTANGEHYCNIRTRNLWLGWQARSALASQPTAAIDVRDDSWKVKAAAWLRGKAADQQKINEEYPRHVECYPSWPQKVRDLNWLANEIDPPSPPASEKGGTE